MPTSYQAGVNSALRHYFKAVAATNSTDTATVLAWMREHPVDLNANLRLDRDWSALRGLHDAGLTRKQLAEHYDCSQTAIRNAMRRLGIQPRPQGGARVKKVRL